MNIRNLITLIFTVGSSLAIPAKDYHIQPRIIEGSEAIPHQFPYMVILTNIRINRCGGTILSDRWILTAAQCIHVEIADNIRIIAGKHDLSLEEFGQQERKAEKLYIHHLFRRDIPGKNDIGLIYLKEPFVFNEMVQPVALPEEESILIGEGIIAGWGATTYGWPNYSDRLKFAKVTILDFKTCKNAVYYYDFDNSNVCSGPLSNEESYCGGDYGGPLVQKINETPTIVGLISFTFEPCIEAGRDIPLIYLRVSHYISWIQKYMQK